MVDTSLQPTRRLGRGRSSRQRRVREAIGEARAALQSTAGSTAPAPRRFSTQARQWGLSFAQQLAAWPQRLRSARGTSQFWGRHWPTLAVLALLGVAVVSQFLGVDIAYTALADQGAGGVLLLSRGPESLASAEAFAFSAAPMIVAQRQPAASDPPPDTYDADLPQASAARTTVVSYTVAPGDTLGSIAADFDVTSYTIYWANSLRSTSLQVGSILDIPPISGVPHTVREGETLESVAEVYGVRTGNIVGYPSNGLKYPYTLWAGQELYIPGGIVEIPSRQEAADGYRPPPTLVQMPGGEKLNWPTWGDVTAPFGWSRGHGAYHNGLDIANSRGTPIYAAAAGEVVTAGWGGLGWYVVIDHGNGFRTEYGHLNSEPFVVEGEQVERGERIGSMGDSFGPGGYVTGVHLHFSVRHRGVYIDPLPLINN